MKDILEAAWFAAQRHSGQRRKGSRQEPYLNHLIETARLVAEHDRVSVIAALLHDVIEDAGVTQQELTARFGAEVAGVVAELTDDKSLPKATRKALQVENAARKSRRAQAVGAADKISNVRSLLNDPPPDWSFARKREYVAWAARVVEGYTELDPALRQEFQRARARFADFEELFGEGDGGAGGWRHVHAGGIAVQLEPRTPGWRAVMLTRQVAGLSDEQVLAFLRSDIKFAASREAALARGGARTTVEPVFELRGDA
ncbi:MAG: HD domain-containing protein [Bryobacteraceae bacterium]